MIVNINFSNVNGEIPSSCVHLAYWPEREIDLYFCHKELAGKQMVDLMAVGNSGTKSGLELIYSNPDLNIALKALRIKFINEEIDTPDGFWGLIRSIEYAYYAKCFHDPDYAERTKNAYLEKGQEQFFLEEGAREGLE